MPIGFHPEDRETLFAEREVCSQQIEKCHALLDSVNEAPNTNGTRAEQLFNRLSAYIELQRTCMA